MTVTLGYVAFYVADVEETLSFYTAAFGLERRFITPEGDYGELRTGATTLSFVSNDLAESNLAAVGGFARIDPTGKPPGMSLTLVTDDVPKALNAALDAGARPYLDPVDKPWGQTVAYVLDPNGILVELGTPVNAE